MLPFELTKDTPYLALSGELWSVFYEYFDRNWSYYKGFLLYFWTGVYIAEQAPIPFHLFMGWNKIESLHQIEQVHSHR